MTRLLTIVILTLSLSTSFSQEFYGTDAARFFAGADKVWIKEGQSLPTFIQLDANSRFPLNQLNERLSQSLLKSPDLSLDYVSTETDNMRHQHHRFYLSWKGMRVQNAMIVVHCHNNMVYALNGTFFSDIKPVNSKLLDEKAALNSALAYFGSDAYMWQFEGEENLLKQHTDNPDTSYFPKGVLEIVPDWVNRSENHHIAWKFNIYAHSPVRRAEVYVDAANGNILFENKLIKNIDSVGTAVTKFSGTQTIVTDFHNNLFRLRETGRGNGIETYNMLKGTNYSAAVDFIDSNNYWNNVNANKDEVATDAHWGAEMTWDYFFYRHHRNSIDNAGFKLRSYVHYNNNYVNAFWDGQRMTYGDGNASIQPLVALDIVAHEISHGLTSNTANLVYQDESGAINEAFSDIFGTTVEFFAKPSAANWTIGENIGMTMRSMSNPKAYGDPNCYLGQNYYIGPNDNGGVHSNSGVLNYWFYLLSHGGSGTNDLSNSFSVTGISIDSAARIAFRMLTVYLTNTSGFAEARYFAIQSALDLYGPCSPQVAATTNAMHAIGVGGQYIPGVHADFEAPLAEFCTPPAQVKFLNKSNNSTTFIWDFGDGNTSTQANPTYTYSTVGNYTVKLRSDGGSCGQDSITKVAFVSINPANRCPFNMPANGTQTLTSCQGRLFDSGGLNNYPDNKTVTTTIAPTGASQITLSFLKFHFEEDFDFLHIYDGPNAASPKIGSFNGKTLPGTNGLIISTGGSITLVQQSDQGLNYEGFELIWDCSFPNAPPVVSFTVSDTLSCTGDVNFTDRSLNGPTSWYWEFGDGKVSILQHPTHTYTSSGFYTVKLTASNAIGSDISIQTSLVHIDLPETPAFGHVANCGQTVFTLNAPVTTGTTHWYDDPTATVPIATGNTYITGLLTQSVSYWVENRIPAQAVYTGKTTNAGGGNYFTAAATHFLVFDVSNPVTIKTVKVYAQSAGNRTVMLRNSSGTNILTKQISIPAGESRITLDFEVPPGTNYQLACSQSNGLYRNNAGCAYPYKVEGLVEIKYSSATTAPTSYYYFFYDWEVQPQDCKSKRHEVKAIISTAPPQPAFAYTMNDPVVSFTDQTTNPGICTWHFGDGTSYTGSNPVHRYLQNGTYTVKLVVDNGCGKDSTTQQIQIVATGVEANNFAINLRVFPNPAKDILYIEASGINGRQTLSLLDYTGRVVYTQTISASDGTMQHTILLNGLAAGMYILRLQNATGSSVIKVIKN